MKANARMRNGLQGDDAGAADVIGAILLVGITVGMMVGLSVLVLSLEGPRDRVHMDIRMSVLPGQNGWGTGDEIVRIEHVGGERLPQSSARVALTVAGAATSIATSALDQGFADGSLGIGDTWERVQTINEGDEVEMLLIDVSGNAVTTRTQLTARGAGTSTGGGGAGGTSGAVTYVATGVATTGTLLNFANMQSADLPTASATLLEASSGGVTSSTTRNPASVTNSLSVTNPNNVLTSNDVRATLSSVGSNLEVAGFTMPVTGVAVKTVTIGMEAQRGSGSGSGSVVALTYELGGEAGATIGTHTVSSNGDGHYTTSITKDRGGTSIWTLADIASMSVIVERQSGSRATQIDHVYIIVTYTTPLITDAHATFGFMGVPGDCDGNHQLQIRYRTALETFTVQVQNDAGTWNSKTPPLSFSSVSPSSWGLFEMNLGKTGNPSGCEYRSGSPQVRIVDADTGAIAGSLQIDFMRIDTT